MAVRQTAIYECLLAERPPQGDNRYFYFISDEGICYAWDIAIEDYVFLFRYDGSVPLYDGSLYVLKNATITGATKTKVTYDAKGLVTGGADATTADIAPSTNRNYVTDAQAVVIGNTSGTNTGDQDLSGYELLSNKTDTITGNTASSTKYGSIKGWYDWLLQGFMAVLPTKTTPVNADGIVINDSADSNKTKLLSFTNLKAFLKTHFDTLYGKQDCIPFYDLQGKIISGNGSVGYVEEGIFSVATYLTGSGGLPRTSNFWISIPLPGDFVSFPSNCIKVQTARNIAVTTFEIRVYNAADTLITQTTINPVAGAGAYEEFNISITGTWAAFDFIKVQIFMGATVATGTIKVIPYQIKYNRI